MKILRISDSWRAALSVGTTLTTRIWVSAASLLHGLGFFLWHGSWLECQSYGPLLKVMPYNYWGLAFITAGVLGFWRVFSPRSNPVCAWIINSYIVTLWLFQMGIRLWGLGPFSVLSVHTVLLIMAAWCFVRTEATKRDTETA
jgi:hypothetical protein